jgi:hypothetical protein
MANIDRFDADKYTDADDLPELSLAGKMVWHITRGHRALAASALNSGRKSSRDH